MITSTRKQLRRRLFALVNLSVIVGVLASAAYLNRQRVWSPGSTTDALKDIRLESGFACIAPTHHPELSAQERPSLGIVLENGKPLPGPAGALHDDIRKIGRGRFSFWADDVYFSSTDNSPPDHNGRSYEIRYPTTVSRFLALVIYVSTVALIGVTAWFATYNAGMRELSRKVLSYYVGPLFNFAVLLSVILSVLLFGAFLNRNGMLPLGWVREVTRGIEPDFGYGKSYLGRGMQIAGLLLCLGALGLALFNMLRVEVPRRLDEVASFSAELLRDKFPLILLCMLLLAEGVFWLRAHPYLQPVSDLETMIVEEQIERAKTINEADVIVIGDSSALMGVDATLLGNLMGGKRVENLSTLAWVGAKGYAHLLEMYSRRGLRVRTVVLLMHGLSLNRPEGAGWDGWEDMVVKESIPRELAKNPYEGFRSELSTFLFGRLFALPMPAVWGRYYGTHLEVADAIRTDHGSIYEPVWALPAETGRWDSAAKTGTVEPRVLPSYGLPYHLSRTAEFGLREFAVAATRFPVEHVFFGIMPTLLSVKTEQAVVDNKRVANQIGVLMRQSLTSRFEPLNLVPFRADEYFSSATHLNQMGREHFTRTLAGILALKMQ